MPYIPKKHRMSVEITGHAKTPGELNYLLTTICLDYLDRHGKNYQQISAVVGQLECCKLEFYRRLAGPYEDQKIAENGDLERYER